VRVWCNGPFPGAKCRVSAGIFQPKLEMETVAARYNLIDQKFDRYVPHYTPKKDEKKKKTLCLPTHPTSQTFIGGFVTVALKGGSFARVDPPHAAPPNVHCSPPRYGGAADSLRGPSPREDYPGRRAATVSSATSPQYLFHSYLDEHGLRHELASTQVFLSPITERTYIS
jgi:hypothetical protein